MVPPGGEERHENGDHPFLPAFQRRHRAADAGIDRAGLGDHAEEAADDQHEQRDVDRGGLIRVGIVEARDRRDEHGAQALRVGIDGLVRAGNRHVLVELFVLLSVVLARRHDPRCGRDDGNQSEEDRVRGRKLEGLCEGAATVPERQKL